VNVSDGRTSRRPGAPRAMMLSRPAGLPGNSAIRRLPLGREDWPAGPRLRGRAARRPADCSTPAHLRCGEADLQGRAVEPWTPCLLVATFHTEATTRAISSMATDPPRSGFQRPYFSTRRLARRRPTSTCSIARELCAAGRYEFLHHRQTHQSKPGIFAPQDAPRHAMANRCATASRRRYHQTPKPRALTMRPNGFQTGRSEGQGLTAFAAHVGLGYTFNRRAVRASASKQLRPGEDDPLDGDVNTSRISFPSNHKFYGQMTSLVAEHHDAAIVFKASRRPS